MVMDSGGAAEASEVGEGRARRGGDRAEVVGERKRRKLEHGGESVGISSTYLQLRSRRILLRNSVYRGTVRLGCGSANPSSVNDSGVSSSSCCYGEESSGTRRDVHDFVDLEEERGSDTETSASRRNQFSKARDEESREFMENSSSTIKSAETTKISDSGCCCSCRRTISSMEETEKSAAKAPGKNSSPRQRSNTVKSSRKSTTSIS